MNLSDITPEIIATKIFECKRTQERCSEGKIISSFWVEPDGSTHIKLPTFLEPEWTGPLLVKAAEIGKYDLFFRGDDYGFTFLNLRRIFKTYIHKKLNYVIVGAILEAKGE